MNKKQFQFFLLALPLCGTFLFTSCSNESEDTGEETKTEEEKTKEPLADRNPEVKEYFKVFNEVVNEYVTVSETTLGIVEKLESGDLNALDAISATSDLMKSIEKIEELNESLGQQGTIKENIEKNLNAADIAEFAEMYSESKARIDSVAAQLEEIDLSSYMDNLDLF